MKLVGILKRSRRIQREYLCINDSLFFDPVFYSSVIDDMSHPDPIMHYCLVGWHAGYNPSPFFDTKYYIENNLDVKKLGTNPLVHYIRHGAQEGRSPSPHFDAEYFCQCHLNISLQDSATSCIQMYGTYAWERKNLTIPKDSKELFIDTCYLFFLGRHAEENDLKDNIDLNTDDILKNITYSKEFSITVIEPILKKGHPIGLRFDKAPTLKVIEWFLENFSITPKSYENISARPKRWTQLLKIIFNDFIFLEKYNIDSNRFKIFIKALNSNMDQDDIELYTKDVISSGLFDGAWYACSYNDVQEYGDLLSHFILFGSREKRSPGPEFNAQWYFEKYMMNDKSGLHPLQHYFQIGKKIDCITRPRSQYLDWVERFSEPTIFEVDELNNYVQNFGATTVFYFYESTDRLKAFYDSLIQQVSGEYNFIIIQYSTNEHEINMVEELNFLNTKIISYDEYLYRLKTINNSRFIVAQSNVILHKTFLAQTAAYHIQGGSILYTDWDNIEGNGERNNPHFTPEYSRRLFTNNPNQVSVISIYNFSTIIYDTKIAVSAFNKVMPLLLQISNKKNTNRISRVLYSKFTDPTDLKTLDPQERVIDIHGADQPTVAIIIPFRDKHELLKDCIESITRLTYYDENKVNIYLVNNDSNQPETLEYIKSLSVLKNINEFINRQPFNFSRLNNQAVSHIKEEIIVFLNNDIVISDPFWLTKMVSTALQSGVGVVGAKLVYPDWTVQHGGVVVGLAGVAGHSHVNLPANSSGYKNLNVTTREVSACTGACLVMKRSIFNEIGGFNTDLAVAFNDIALCISAISRGYDNVFVNDAILIHHESKSRGLDSEPQHRKRFMEEAISFRKIYWPPFKEDNFYSPNLSNYNLYSLAFPPRITRVPLSAKKNRATFKILFLSSTYQIGHGVAVVIDQQVKYLRKAGHEVFCGGIVNYNEYESCQHNRVDIKDPESAAQYAMSNDFDAVIAHTPPYFSCVRYLGRYPVVIQYDYGEPNPSWFPDSASRISINDEKRFCFSISRYLSCISEAIRDEAGFSDMRVIRIANSHLGRWAEKDFDELRIVTRKQYNWENKKVILNVCRFGRGERYYKGIDKYIDLYNSSVFRWGSENIVFILVGKGDDDDVQELKSLGLDVFANVSDKEMFNIYIAADIYANFSKWEGYNLGIAQALSLGLPVIASEIPAHKAFPIELANSQTEALLKLEKLVSDDRLRNPVIYEWAVSLAEFDSYIRQCVDDTLRDKFN